MHLLRLTAFVGGLAVAPVLQAQAGLQTIDISAVVNGGVGINAWTIPTGVSTGNEGTGVPFDIATNPATDYAGSWIAAGQSSPGTSPILQFDLAPLDLYGQTSFYALLNNYYGTLGADEYNVMVTATNGDSVTYQSIGGMDTRDYNENPDTTETVTAATVPWFDNGIGQRLDMRQFILPASFYNETLASFQIDQIDSSDPAVLSGLTFSTQPVSSAVPEPCMLGAFGIGFAGLAWRRERRRSQIRVKLTEAPNGGACRWWAKAVKPLGRPTRSGSRINRGFAGRVCGW